MPTERLRIEDYLPVDVDRLRPADAYGQMIEIRRRRMQAYWNEQGRVREELVEDVPCPLCGGKELAPLFVKEGFHFVRCDGCSLVHVNPRLRADAVVDVYTDESYSEIIERLVASSNDYRTQRFGEERMDIVERFCPRGGRLLDVGCTTGFQLEAAERRGWEAHGVEANPYAAEVAAGKGLRVVAGTVEDSDYEAGTFDAVTIFDVIEHLPSPLDVLRKVRTLLRPGGTVFVYTPNWDCAERLLMGEESHFIWGTNHLVYFTVDTLAEAFDRCGFDVVHHETQGLDVEDLIWWLDHERDYDTAFLRDHRHELQFLCNAGDWGKNLRMYAVAR